MLLKIIFLVSNNFAETCLYELKISRNIEMVLKSCQHNIIQPILKLWRSYDKNI